MTVDITIGHGCSGHAVGRGMFGVKARPDKTTWDSKMRQKEKPYWGRHGGRVTGVYREDVCEGRVTNRGTIGAHTPCNYRLVFNTSQVYTV